MFRIVNSGRCDEMTRSFGRICCMCRHLLGASILFDLCCFGLESFSVNPSIPRLALTGRFVLEAPNRNAPRHALTQAHVEKPITYFMVRRVWLGLALPNVVL